MLFDFLTQVSVQVSYDLNSPPPLSIPHSSTLLMSRSDTQSEPDKMTVHEFFQSIPQHDVNM